ncbi:DUF3035 domain-containing protein [Acidocella aminolytica]|uniref:DUF3035 domain-containing protein n=1 Tax=Acidocella aminolytica 101 = DSM 11237 TaxID=1120923 RepID=A0A0D6PDB1_9PROT|nr:DUF3035 domain-containing protein [Acidocella aminolytica]GAN79740.1 hypothetical protein Aam_028_004 [Acidocella aminolytica 101 = DSM 11237]GBQ38616.1 hypothetical protein AA11237_1853 [Acidocella aminolytica 101 = DSM 11237]SHE75733.1 Beta-barrel assembly machine subunit BamF [Acidocella aminolytica 101 = DSM 11237]
MITRRAIAVPSTIVLALALAGCSSGMKKTFGLEANPPNAYEVGSLPPLSLPPELGQLPAPNPGQPPTQEVSAAQEGANVIAPANALPTAPPSMSTADNAFLNQAGPAPQGNIRAQVNQNAAVSSRSSSFVNSLMDDNSNAPTVVNASAEQRRLQENAALGKPATAGATPQETSAPPSLWDRFLNIF